MEKRGLLLIFALLFTVFFVTAACPHGVIICGIHYNCGISDSVCPSDFGVNCTDSANFCYFSDPDCGGTCATSGPGPIGNADCKAKDITKPNCCAGGVCALCCASDICNTTFAPAAAPGAMYNTNGDYSCQAQCNSGACNKATTCTNCNLQDNWYNVTPLTTQWINSTTNVCQLQRQVSQVYRDFTATGSICSNVTTSSRWANETTVISNKTAGTVCQIRSAQCQLNDTCDGFGNCVANYRPSTFQCRAAVGVCDVAENCTGSSPNCPADSFAPTTKQCNATLACSSGTGNNFYNSGGSSLCKGYCDGSNSCDYADSCSSCGSTGCSDSDPANNQLVKGNITLAGGCSVGACTSSSVVWDTCSGTSTQEITCSGPSQGVTLSYQCNNYDTSNCWCTTPSPVLNQVCNDWGCTNGICAYSGSDWTSNSWTCIPALEGSSQSCPLTGGIPATYKCYRTNAGVWNWSSGVLPAESACADGYDNDLDGLWDYDTDNRGGKGSSPHGDNTCPVGVSPPVETPASVTPSQVFTANVTATAQVNSINAKINGVECKFSKWNILKASFNCTAPATPGIYTVLFYINTSKSFQSGGNVTSNNINVVAGSCTGLSQAICSVTPTCEWCVDCVGRKGNSDPALSRCVDIGDCSSFRGCYAGQCALDTCDLSSGCTSTCTGNIVNNFNCDTSTCTCTPAAGENCNLKNCSTNIACIGAGTPILSLTGDHYVCSGSPGACTTSGTTTCASYLCTVIGQSQLCNGKTYYCVFNGSIIVWNETMPTTEICNDGVDNNGDGLTDCQDTINCPPDNTPYCCNITRIIDTTQPGDDGMQYGANLFDAPGNYGNPPNCCGNNPNEWYWNIGGGACCDQSSDCVDASGACFNNNTPLVEAHQQHCINHVWYPCNDTNHVNGEVRGTYICTDDPSTGGWGWRTIFPPENCTDGIDNNFDTKIDCNDPTCMGKCAYGCASPENLATPGTCTDGIDNNCNGKIDAQDGSNCTEGSSNVTTSPSRMCNDFVSNEVAPLSDAPDPPLVDLNDDGCCDLCSPASGMYFDTAGGARTQCGVPGCNCGSLTFSSWESGTVPYCCGDDATNEFYKINPLNASQMACCNSSAHCVDNTGKCQVGLEETEALCSDGIDNDCDGLIDCQDTNCTGTLVGRVTDEKGQGVSGAIVKSSPPGKSQECERTATTLSDGSYTLNALIGSYNIIARKPGYDDNITFITVVAPPGSQTVNFKLRNGTCHADCTDSYGNCNSACNGLSFTNATGGVDYCIIAPGCANRPKNFRATEISGTTVTEYTCCEGETTRTYPAKPALVSGNMENLYVYKTVVKLGLKFVTLNIAYWYPCENC